MNVYFPSNGRYMQMLGPIPLVPIQLQSDQPTIWCKLEFLNPSGSTKDRIARYILEKAWRSGHINPNSEVIEASSGSTSIALSMVCAQFQIRFTAVVPENVSSERGYMIRAYGGNIHYTPKEQGIKGAITAAKELASKIPNAFLPMQFENPDNSEAHRVWTGNEILNQIPEGVVHAVVSGIGTGGTIVGLYQAFKDASCPIIPVAAYPMANKISEEVECVSFSKRIPGVVQGMSKIYAEANLDFLEEVEVDDDVALATTRKLIRMGLPVGPSSGLNFAAALEIAKKLGKHAKVVTVFPDRMERYFSTELFQGYR